MAMAVLVANAVQVSSVPKNASWMRQQIETLRVGKGLVASTQLTGLAAIGSAAWWGTYALSATATGPVGPLALTAATAASAKFLGNKDGAVAVFTDYLPKACLLTRSAACRLALSLFGPAPDTTDTGIWKGQGVDVRWSQFPDERLGEALVELLNVKQCYTSYDFGCGQHNAYAKMLTNPAENRVSDGVDGAIANSLSSIQADLTDEHLNLEQRDCVISLEVGAKIPQKFQKQFLDNIVRFAKKMAIVSWPTPGQGGPCNDQNPLDHIEVIQEFDQRGWEVDQEATRLLRQSAHPIYFWHRENLLVFRPKLVAS